MKSESILGRVNMEKIKTADQVSLLLQIFNYIRLDLNKFHELRKKAKSYADKYFLNDDAFNTTPKIILGRFDKFTSSYYHHSTEVSPYTSESMHNRLIRVDLYDRDEFDKTVNTDKKCRVAHSFVMSIPAGLIQNNIAPHQDKIAKIISRVTSSSSEHSPIDLGNGVIARVQKLDNKLKPNSFSKLTSTIFDVNNAPEIEYAVFLEYIGH